MRMQKVALSIHRCGAVKVEVGCFIAGEVTSRRMQVALRIHRCGAVKVEVGDTGEGFLIFSGYMNV